MGNHANKRAAAARHNARYEQRDAVRPNLTKASRFEGKNVGTIGHVDHGIKRNVGGRLSVLQRLKQFTSYMVDAYLKRKLIGR